MTDEWSELEAKAKAAGMVEWHHIVHGIEDNVEFAPGEYIDNALTPKRARFIAAANPEAVLKLIAAIRERDAEIGRLRINEDLIRRGQRVNEIGLCAKIDALLDQLRIAREALGFYAGLRIEVIRECGGGMAEVPHTVKLFEKARAALEKIGETK